MLYALQAMGNNPAVIYSAESPTANNSA